MIKPAMLRLARWPSWLGLANSLPLVEPPNKAGSINIGFPMKSVK